jgi:integrase
MKPKREKKRRQHGSGSIFKKRWKDKRTGEVMKCDTWFIQFYRNGKRVRESTGSSDFEYAKKELQKRLAEVAAGEYQARHGKPARVEDLYDALKLHQDANPRARERDLKGRWENHLEPVFGAMLVTDVTTEAVDKYRTDRLNKDKAKPATINRELAALKRMFRLAMRSTPPKVKQVPYIPMFPEDNARQGFVEHGDFDRLAAEARELWLRTFLELGFTYGWRASELLGLRVRQVNFTLGTIRLDPGTTKNREGRQVSFEAKSKVADLLRETVRGKEKEDFVLTRKGKPIKDYRAAWRALCCRAGLGQFVCRGCKATTTSVKRKCKKCGSRKRRYEGRIPHDLRRSMAKAARIAGVPETVVMAMGGWKTAAMFRRYAIVSDADQKVAVKMMARARAKHTAKAAAEQQATAEKLERAQVTGRPN